MFFWSFLDVKFFFCSSKIFKQEVPLCDIYYRKDGSFVKIVLSFQVFLGKKCLKKKKIKNVKRCKTFKLQYDNHKYITPMLVATSFNRPLLNYLGLLNRGTKYHENGRSKQLIGVLVLAWTITQLYRNWIFSHSHDDHDNAGSVSVKVLQIYSIKIYWTNSPNKKKNHQTNSKNAT